MVDSTCVPFLDVGATYRELRAELDEAHARVMASGWFVLGRELEAFEHEFARYCGTEHGVGVGSGLDALTLALRSLGIGRGDEVIVPANTFIATWLAVSAVGATPVPVDPDEHSHHIGAPAVARAVGPRTKAVIPVHLYGAPVDLEPILELAADRGLRVIEDAAQAHGARHASGTRVGASGDAVCWSFYPSKNLGAFGDGGAVTTRSSDIASRLRVLRNYGSARRDEHEVQGVNSRIDELQAAALRVKLQHLDEWNRRRAQVAARYAEALASEPSLTLPAVHHGSIPSWHLYVVRHPDRDRLQADLADSGIETLVHYPTPPHRQRVYNAVFRPGDFPIAEKLAGEVLSLPIGPHLSDDQVTAVIDAVHASGTPRSRVAASRGRRPTA